MIIRACIRILGFAAVLLPVAARAQAVAESAPLPSDVAAPAPPPYSLPWQLRPAAIGTVVRSDTAFAFLEDPASGNGGNTVASTLLATYKLTPEIAPLVRIGFVKNSPPDPGEGAASFVNPVIGGTYLLKLSPEYRLAFFLGLAIPVGMGGGNDPELPVAAATGSGVLARSAMDNAMFAVNDLTVFPGVDLAYVAGGLTAQVEVTLLQLTRVRGEDVQPDSKRTNFTSGLHIGYFVIPELSVGSELRYQRWLSTPKPVEADSKLRDNATFALGIRTHFQAGPSIWLRPGLAYARGIDDPMAKAGYNIVQLDLPVAF